MLDVRALRLRPHLTLLTVLCLVAGVLAGCGDDSSGGPKLASATADSLEASLDRIEQDVGSRDCSGASQQADTLHQQVESLSHVNRRLRRALERSTARLASLIADQCEPAAQAPTEPQATTGASGPTGEEGENKDKGNKKEKKPKPSEDQTNPDEQVPPDTQDGGGGTTGFGESTTGGSN
jgi:hypothetical protein